ncbi:hypothetical protein [Flectobacillus roseus]|uniref:hypothetical protein n=1 Tax=Flectobacillus roseus TaxID=502259 RepID=UPI0024B7CC77|nr:hypothetical protein [Flectobacillus roseus]MDI9871004.1 hypothetical protein [Flectobacillus roseus]
MYKTYFLLSFFWICILFKSHSAMLYAENIRTTDSTILDIRASKDKPFKFYYKISSIPRYMLVGRDGTIISDNAPRPTDQHIRSFLDEILKK